MREVTLTAIFEGTIFSIDEEHTPLHDLLHHHAAGIRIHAADELVSHPQATHFKMGFNGCGVDYGTMGLLFGSGLDNQCQQVEAAVKELIRAGNKVNLVAIGLSRGGVAAILLAKLLAEIDAFHLNTRLLLLDPVPGNLLLTVKLDVLNFTLANQAMDVSMSKNLSYVKSLYPYLEVGDDSEDAVDQAAAPFHIPIRPRFPAHCECDEDVILGAHLDAFRNVATSHLQPRAVHGVDTIPIIRQYSKEMIYDFLRRAGALSAEGQETDVSVISVRFNENPEQWSTWLQALIADVLHKNREMHAPDASFLSAGEHDPVHPFLNKYHRTLEQSADQAPENLCLKVVPFRPRAVIEKQPLSNALLLAFLEQVYQGMTETSRLGRKGQLMQTVRARLQTDMELSEEQLSFVLRDIIAIGLQRDRFSISLFGTTHSGYAMLTALNDPLFRDLALCLKPDGAEIIYRDLSCYVLGREDLAYFSSDNKDANLELVEQTPSGEDRFGRLIL